MIDITLDKWMPYKRPAALKNDIMKGKNFIVNDRAVAKNKEGDARLKKTGS